MLLLLRQWQTRIQTANLSLESMEHDNKKTLDVIHGDIKPQKTLTFDDVPGAYSRIGYHTQYAEPNDLILMPKSQRRAAPEWHHRRCFTPAQAMKMDSYLFFRYAGTMAVVLQHARRLGFQVRKRLKRSIWSEGSRISYIKLFNLDPKTG